MQSTETCYPKTLFHWWISIGTSFTPKCQIGNMFTYCDKWVILNENILMTNIWTVKKWQEYFIIRITNIRMLYNEALIDGWYVQLNCFSHYDGISNLRSTKVWFVYVCVKKTITVGSLCFIYSQTRGYPKEPEINDFKFQFDTKQLYLLHYTRSICSIGDSIVRNSFQIHL